jgi:hypothetical protein
MPVENLSVIGVSNGASDALAGVADWMGNHGIQPSWVVGGGALGLVFGGFSFTAAAKGALLGGILSWVFHEFG